MSSAKVTKRSDSAPAARGVDGTLEGCHVNPFSIADKKSARKHLAKFAENRTREEDVAGSLINGSQMGLMMEPGAPQSV